MKSYLELLRHVMDNGQDREDRTGVGTRGVFGYQWRHAIVHGYPLLTTKKVHFRSVITELCWFLRGDTNIKYLTDRGVTIWNEWADKDGELGPVYGRQWRHWRHPDGHGIDQIGNLLKDLILKPNSRRHIVSAWNPSDVPGMALPPCHTLWQCYVSNGTLSLHLYARSIDSFLGLPFNIASYAALIIVLAKFTNLEPGELIISFGDLHIYKNHFDQVREQLKRGTRPLPTLDFTPEVWNLDEIQPEWFTLNDYLPHPAIKAPIAV